MVNRWERNTPQMNGLTCGNDIFPAGEKKHQQAKELNDVIHEFKSFMMHTDDGATLNYGQPGWKGKGPESSNVQQQCTIQSENMRANIGQVDVAERISPGGKDDCVIAAKRHGRMHEDGQPFSSTIRTQSR